MSDMIEVVIDSIRVHLMTPQRVVVLKQTSAERYLTIWVGPYEAEAITVALQEVEMSRPRKVAFLPEAAISRNFGER